MAQKTVVTLIDDLTGEEAEAISTVEFALDGVTYEIDLADGNAAQLREVLASYVAAGRKTGGRRARAARTGRQTGRTSNGDATGSGYNRETLKAICAWAKQNGHGVSDRGRLPAGVVTAWETQHQRAKGKTPAFPG
jgi:hypothetical protein